MNEWIVNWIEQHRRLAATEVERTAKSVVAKRTKALDKLLFSLVPLPPIDRRPPSPNYSNPFFHYPYFAASREFVVALLLEINGKL